MPMKARLIVLLFPISLLSLGLLTQCGGQATSTPTTTLEVGNAPLHDDVTGTPTVPLPPPVVIATATPTPTATSTPTLTPTVTVTLTPTLSPTPSPTPSLGSCADVAPPCIYRVVAIGDNFWDIAHLYTSFDITAFSNKIRHINRGPDGRYRTLHVDDYVTVPPLDWNEDLENSPLFEYCPANGIAPSRQPRSKTLPCYFVVDTFACNPNDNRCTFQEISRQLFGLDSFGKDIRDSNLEHISGEYPNEYVLNGVTLVIPAICLSGMSCN